MALPNDQETTAKQSVSNWLLLCTCSVPVTMYGSMEQQWRNESEHRPFQPKNVTTSIIDLQYTVSELINTSIKDGQTTLD